ncbi:MAG: lipopolysaccharide kinase InaA family protein, partial [Nocardioides sp.]|uniref:lipopolysaccharide kinase InaA family protein n=1 Tax=Nocardioides sp. TaxID=35761 RepID=UPI003265A3BC
MALRIVASRPDPAIVTLPWSTPLEEWTDDYVVPLPRGLSRHIVRIIRLRDRTYAVKETQESIAFREYRLLRDLQRVGLPAVVPQGVVAGRVDTSGEELPATLITEHLRFSLPYRSLFAHGMTADNLPSLIDAIVVLLVRLHLAGFFWGDVSLSNVLFR